MILNQISNKLRNTSDPVPESSEDVPATYLPVAMQTLSFSLNFFLAVSVIALLLKHWLWTHARDSRTRHTPEAQAIERELNAQGFWKYFILVAFETLPFFIQIAVFFFYLGGSFTVESLGSKWNAALSFLNWSATNRKILFLVVTALSTVMNLALLSWYVRYAFPVPSLDLQRRAMRMVARMLDVAPDPEIVYADISNCLFAHTSIDPKNFPIFIQLFSLPVKRPRIRIRSLAPWSELSPLLPSMIAEIYSKPRYNPLPALRLCLVVSGQGQSEQLQVNSEAKRVYSTIKTSHLLQNLYLHLLLSQIHATGDTDHWQDACQILKYLEYSEEHTSELVWLVDSIELYTPWVKEDFTTQIVEFLQGVVVYLTKCPGDEHNVDLLQTATIMAAERLKSRQRSNIENPSPQYILSSQDVHSDERYRDTFALVENESLSQDDRLPRIIAPYQDSNFVIRTLLISIMAIEGFGNKNNEKSISGVVPRSDLQCALEGLWGLWEAGFNQSDLLQFLLVLVPPPSPLVGGTQSSMVILLLKEYLQQINDSPALIAEKAFRFTDAALKRSLTTGITSDELDLHLQDLQSPNPWISLHIDSILRRRSTPRVADLEAVATLDPRVKAIVSKERLNLYLSSNVQPEPDILTLLVQPDDLAISLEAFGQGVNLLESPLIGESDGQSPGSPCPFPFAQLEQEQRSHLISRFFDPHQSTSACQSVWIMLTEDLYPRWELLPADWRSDIAEALVEWVVKGQKIFAEEVKKPKAKQLIGATVLALVNYNDMKHHRRRKIPLEARDERFEERLDACAQVYLQLFATAIEDLGERAKPRTQHIVNFLVDIPDGLYHEGAINRIRRVLEI